MGTSWITPNESYIAGNGWGFADANAINNNLDYIRNQASTFYGFKTFNGLTANSTVAITNTTSGRVETRLKQGAQTNFWNVGLNSSGNYMITTNANGNMDTGIIMTIDKSTRQVSVFEPFIVNGGSSAISLKMTTSGSGLSNTIIQENTNGTTSGRLETRYKQDEDVNFWNVGLDSSGDYKIATNANGNMDTGVAVMINKSTRNFLINTVVDNGSDKLQLNGNAMINGSGLPVSLSITTSGSGFNNSIIQENTSATSSGRVETRLKQATQTNFWNVGLHNSGDYRITTNINGNMDTGIVLSVDKSTRAVTVTEDLNVSGHINPTTTPTESVTPTITVDGNTEYIPKGLWNILLYRTGAIATTLTLERLQNGVWADVVESTDTTTPILAKGLQSSSSTDLRIRLSGSGSGYASLSKT